MCVYVVKYIFFYLFSSCSILVFFAHHQNLHRKKNSEKNWLGNHKLKKTTTATAYNTFEIYAVYFQNVKGKRIKRKRRRIKSTKRRQQQKKSVTLFGGMFNK